MYLEFYGLSRKPFSIVPNPELFYPSPKHSMALTYLEYGLTQGDSFVMLTGEIGAGKTTLIHHLLRKIQSRVDVAVIFNTNIDADTLLRMVLGEFELAAEDDKARNLEILHAFLLDKYAKGRRVVLIVDEAQNLAREALEEVRMLSNLQTADSSLLQIILVGQPELRQRMLDPSLAQLAQRISVSYHLGPLTPEETAAYIRHRLELAGRTTELFTAEAVALVAERSGGVPRIINTLCDTALVYGYADGMTTIGRDVVDTVVRDRQETLLQACPATAEGLPEARTGQPAQASQDAGVFQRLAALEVQVARLGQLMDGQLQELRSDVDVERANTIRQLENMIAQERERSAKLLAACAKLKQRIHQLEAQMTGQMTRQTARPETTGEALTALSPAAEGEEPSAPKRSFLGIFGGGRSR